MSCFAKLQQLWPLNALFDHRICFLLNILRINGQHLTKFCINIIIDKIYVGIVKHHFLKIYNGVTALDLYQNLVLLHILRMNGQNLTKILYTHYHWQDLSEFGFAPYLENEWTEFNQFCKHIIIGKIYVWIVTLHQFFKQSYAPEYISVL